MGLHKYRGTEYPGLIVPVLSHSELKNVCSAAESRLPQMCLVLHKSVFGTPIWNHALPVRLAIYCSGFEMMHIE